MFPGEYDTDDPYTTVLDSLLNSTSDDIISLRDAISRDDEQEVRRLSKLLHGNETLDLKREAINRRKPQILKILLSEDDTIDDLLMTAACESRQRDVISTLVKYGWPVNTPLSLGMSPLWLAVDNMEFMQWLISLGVDVNARSAFEQSTLSKAIVDGDKKVVDFLLAQEDYIDSDLLHCAAQRSNKVEGAILATKLLELGARVHSHHYENNSEMLRNQWFSKRGTPLHTACSEENVPVTEVLLRHGADPDALMLERDQESGPTPVNIAKEKFNVVLLDPLMAHHFQSKLQVSS